MQRGKGAVRRRAAHVKEGDRMTRATELVYGEYFLAVRAGVVSLSAATPACGLVLLFELCYKRAVIYAWVRATSRCGFLYSVRDARHARRYSGREGYSYTTLQVGVITIQSSAETTRFLSIKVTHMTHTGTGTHTTE